MGTPTPAELSEVSYRATCQTHPKDLLDGSEILGNVVGSALCVQLERLCFVLLTPTCNIKLLRC